MPADGPWADVVGYARAVRVGTQVMVAGTTAARPDGRPVGGDDAAAQAHEALRRIVAALAELGARPEDVVRTRCYLTDVTRWDDVGRAHAAVFGAVRPACTMVQVAALLGPELLVEIEADAIVG